MTDFEYEEDGLEKAAFSVKDMQNLAKDYIRLFFTGKVEETKIEEICTPRNTSLVLNLDIRTGIPIIYEAMKPFVKAKKKGKFPSDMEFVLKQLKRCARLTVLSALQQDLSQYTLRYAKGVKYVYDVKFLGGVFFQYDLPLDKKFLYKYFRSPLEKQFVRYYLCFGQVEYFVEHTGYECQKRWVNILKKRFDKIMELHTIYKRDMDLEKLSHLEKGKVKGV